jgi:hemerythrin-like domain-containing protein
MTRHPSLRDLSFDHHHALVQALRLRRAGEGDHAHVQQVAREFLAFWDEHTRPHFREEEEALLPFFARWGDPDAEPIARMLREHVLIRRDVALLQSASTWEASSLRALGEALEAHVRLEERVVFPLIEASLPPHALDALPQVLAAWEASTPGSPRRSSLCSSSPQEQA